MTKTGPQKYPGASLTYWYGSKYPGDSMESNVVVWHTTEGRSLPSYDGGSQAPNFTAVPDFGARRLRWYQHFDFDTSSRALVNKSGGVETNTLNAVQVEIVGTCDPATHKAWENQGYEHLYTPNLPTWVVDQLGDFARWARDNHGVPLASGLTFRPYPSSYGNSPVRMSGAKWESFKGHCGHQHVPENDHGDPGAFPVAAVLLAAGGSPTDSGDDDMDPFDVWNYKGVDESSDAYAYLRNTKAKLDVVEDEVALLKNLVLQQGTQLVALTNLVKVVSAKLDA